MNTPLTSAPIVRSLGLRLKHIFNWGQSAGPYTDIWDLCCDHGRLGLHFYQSPMFANCRIHLIDCVPSIIDILKSRFRDFLGPRLTITCMDASELVLPRVGRHLIIIAGVGGETMATILQNITQRLQTCDSFSDDFRLEYMLSPNLGAFELRRFLRANNFELLAEEFVSEKGWHHEHLYMRYHSRPGSYTKSTVVGNTLWYPLAQPKKRYLEKYIQHYKKRLELRGDASVAPALKAYAEILGEENENENEIS